MKLSAFRRVGERKALAAICLLILCIMLVAALWPFNPHPANHVAWLGDRNGVRFGGGGIILSPGRLELTDSEKTPGVSLEIWLEPEEDSNSANLLAISSTENPEQFRLRQSHDDLLIVEEPFPSIRHSAAKGLWVAHAFQVGKSRLVTISSATPGTMVYLDGILAKKSSSFRFTGKDLSGQLILGSSPVSYDTWSGKLLGVALFNRELTSAQASQHYQAWLNGRTESIKNDQPVALYTFGERAGSVVHNQIISRPDLSIPESFDIPYKPFLKAPWKEFYPNLAYLKDIFINIAGFVPFGFLFCAYLSAGQAGRKTVLATIILGATFSFTIEVLQVYIPMRNSGTTDIFTNTLGTAIGALLYRQGTIQAPLGGLGSPKAL
jgi:hypothetical protein